MGVSPDKAGVTVSPARGGGCRRGNGTFARRTGRASPNGARSVPRADIAPRGTDRTPHRSCACEGCARPLHRAKEVALPAPHSTPSRSQLLHERARAMRSAMTASEARLWSALSGSQLGVAFRRHVVIGDFIVDFRAPVPRLVVEFDGGYHELRAPPTLAATASSPTPATASSESTPRSSCKISRLRSPRSVWCSSAGVTAGDCRN